MDSHAIPVLLGKIAVMLGCAKLCGAAAKRLDQPTVLGELIAGILLGASVLGVVEPQAETVMFASEVGVVILLFLIGLETDLKGLLKVGWASVAVASVGVVLPFALGYAVCHAVGLEPLVSVVAGAALTATSVGITARVLSDLGRLHEPESKVILGAAVIDDVIGLIILTIVAGLAAGEALSYTGILKVSATAFGFLVLTLAIGSRIMPFLLKTAAKIELPGTVTVFALIIAFGLAWLADQAGSAVIIGAFAGGLLLSGSERAKEIEHGITEIGHLFVPLFFVTVGASVDVRDFNPFDNANHHTLLVGGLLIVAAIVGKLAAGFAAPWFEGNKLVIGVGMIPRGEVGLIFAQMGLSAGVFDSKMFGAVTLMVMVTTFIAPPLLKGLFPPITDETVQSHIDGIEKLVAGER